jgi:hypothetical protein
MAGKAGSPYRPPVEPLLRLGEPDTQEPPIDYGGLGGEPHRFFVGSVSEGGGVLTLALACLVGIALRLRAPSGGGAKGGSGR